MRTDGFFGAAIAVLFLCLLAAPRLAAQIPALGGGYPTDFFPPRNVSFEGPGPVVYPPGIISRNVSFSSPDTTRMSPPAGQSMVTSFSMMYSGEVSSDGGATFTRVMAPAAAVIRNTHAGPAAVGGTQYNTEMLALNISGGTLPAGALVRESPTRASTGQTVIRDAGGGYFRIDSFFDIFTELSVDGGQTWNANGGAGLHVVMRRLAQPHVFPADVMPPMGRFDQAPASGDVVFGNGVILRALSHHRKTPGNVPGAAAGNFEFAHDEMEFLFSTDGGASFNPLTAPLQGITRAVPVQGLTGVSLPGGGTLSVFDTEMLSLNLSGGGLPPGVRLRESPTLASTGRHRSLTADGGFQIDSFFDVFTELSLDGGQSWTPAQQAVRLESAPNTTPAGGPAPFFPPAHFGLSMAPALRLTSVCSGNGTQTRRWRVRNPHKFPVSYSWAIGVAQDFSTPADFEFEVSHDNGQTWSPVTHPVTLNFRITRRGGNGTSVGSFDTEMLSMAPAGGGNVRVRESPSRASTGKMMITGTDLFHIDSFFDVFTDLSIDAGQNWSPAESPARVELTGHPVPDFYPSNFLPLKGITAMDDWETPVAYSGAVISVGVRLYSRGGTTYNSFPPPAPGSNGFMDYTDDACLVSVTNSAGVVTDFTATATVRARAGDPNGDSVFDTEMLQLDISGGGLPAGTMIRESPSRASTGRMSMTPVNGGFSIDSFFDVFTELSLDGGQTWFPAVEPMHLVQHAARNPVVMDKTFPVRDHTGPVRRAMTQGGLSIGGLELEYGGARTWPFPPTGGTLEVTESFRLAWDTETDVGQKVKHHGSASVVLRVTPRDATAGADVFDTEMLSLNLTSVAPGSVRVRESPSRRSTGQVTITMDATGRQNIDSFFDVFVDLSIDGGATWHPTDAPLRIGAVPGASPVTLASNTLPPTATVSDAAGDLGRVYPVSGGGKVTLRDYNYRMQGPPPPLPAAGASGNVNFNSDARLDLVLADGSSVAGNCSFGHVVLIGHDFDEANGTRFFDTEMLSLSLTNSTLPPHIRLRESPTLRSTGRTTSRALPNGTFRIDSFFDVFTELSLDSGATWVPSDGPMHVASAPLAPAISAAMLHFAPTDFFPPPGVIRVPGRLEYPNLTVLSDFEFRPSPTSPFVPLPPPGVSVDVTINGVASYIYSDATGTVLSRMVPAQMTLRVTGAPAGSDRYFDTEMLALSINDPAGGFMIRESPTLPSTGGTRIVQTEGGFMVDSFFDVFTELSVDGGQTWLPGLAVGRAELQPQPPVVSVPTNFFPPRHSVISSLPNAPAMDFGGGVLVRRLHHEDFQQNAWLVDTTAPDTTVTCPHMATFEVSNDGGSTWQPHTAPATATINVAAGDVNGDGVFDTEMLQLDISGGTLPSGVRLRESPSKASTGRTRLRPAADGSFRIDSFFDVFTELSLDGGQSWKPSAQGNVPESIVLDTGRRRDFHSSNFFPLVSEIVSRPGAVVRFAGGGGGGGLQPVIIERLARPAINEGLHVSPPVPGASQTHDSTSPVSFMLSQDGGQSFSPVSAMATISMRVSNHGGGVNGIGSFDTEMLQLSISGGTLPGGFRIRESPTRASLGRTSIRIADGGFRIDSFFDVFTELSLDNGQSWMPAADLWHIEEIANSQPVIVGGPIGHGTDAGSYGARTAGGMLLESMELIPVSTLPTALPIPGQVNTTTTDYDLVFRHRQEFGPVQMQRHRCSVVVRLTPSDAAGAPGLVFDTEMLALNLNAAGGAAGGGMRIRESPTRASMGRSSIRQLPGGRSSIDSFFDVFTELSLDGGQSWVVTDLPLHVGGHPGVPKVMMPSASPPPALTLSQATSFRGLVYSEGTLMNFLSATSQTGAGPLPGPGQEQVFDFDGSASLVTSRFPYQSSRVNPQLGTYRVRHVSDNGPVRTFDTEMLSLNISGGGLPAGTMIRESPTLRSTGKTTATALPGGTFFVQSFFDVFTEFSSDGGGTWSPSHGATRLNLTHPQRSIVAGLDDNAPPFVRLFGGGGLLANEFLAFHESFRGGVRVAVGDVNGDGTADIITGSGPAVSGSVVKIIDGTRMGTMRSFHPYPAGFSGGVFVAAGDVDGDGRAEVITGSGVGAAHVKVIDATRLTELRSFPAYGAFAGGVSVAAGDVNGDGFADIITGAGAGAPGGHVKVFNGLTGAELRSFFAYQGFNGGVFVAAGDVNGDGFADLIAGAGANAPGGHVKVFDGVTGAMVFSFFAYDASFAGGVRVAAGDVNGDGFADIITGSGRGAQPHVKVFDGTTGALMSSFFAWDSLINNGAYVAGAPVPDSSAIPNDGDGDGLLDEWEVAHWGTTEGRDGMDDSDDDGAPAIIELGFGLDPKKPDITGLPRAMLEDGFLTMTITKRPGVYYEVQSGDSVAASSFGASDTTVLIDDLTTLKVRDNVPFSDARRRYLRAVVTGTP